MMKVNFIFKWVLVPLLVAAGVAFYKYCPWVKQDNPLEEQVEVMLHENTGHDVDLSPDSKEK